jgi:3-oxoacyl-[acyl-carrier protein] reductase
LNCLFPGQLVRKEENFANVKLTDRIALVTGGGTGIGRAVSLALATAGIKAVVINFARSRADAERTVAEVEKLGCSSFAVKADVSVDEEVRHLVEAVVERFGRLDVLINNAGTTEYVDIRDLEGVTDAAWDAIFNVNLRGSFYCARAAAPHLKASGGVIVNVSSVAAHRGAGSSLPYSISKAGVSQLTRVLAIALAPEVRVNAVSPGQVETRWARSRKGEDFAAAAEARTRATTPLRRNAQPEDIADAILGLIRSDFVTGQDLLVDGGRSMTLS